MSPAADLRDRPSFPWAPRNLFSRIALLIVCIALVQFGVTVALYDAISRASIREDHARRVAELLEVSARLHAQGDPELVRIMSTRHLKVWITAHPKVGDAAHKDDLDIRRLVRQWEPDLQSEPLFMAVEHSGAREHLIGSMRLSDGSWLNFRSIDLSSRWPAIASATVVTVILTGLSLIFTVLALRQLGAPLRRLTRAAHQIGDGKPIHLREDGPSDLKNLSHAFNEMQARIAQILKDQALSMVALSHDLRTPLSRLKVATDFIDAEDIRTLVSGNVDEMEALIASLQRFLKAHEIGDVAQTVDLDLLLQQIAAPWSPQVAVEAATPGERPIRTYPLVLRLALEPLIENAVQFGGSATIRVEQADGSPRIQILDQGPGIPADDIPKLIEPFFRGDASRQRDTAGFGLGIPTAHRLLKRYGGDLSFRNAPGGGLEATIDPPRAT